MPLAGTAAAKYNKSLLEFRIRVRNLCKEFSINIITNKWRVQ